MINNRDKILNKENCKEQADLFNRLYNQNFNLKINPYFRKRKFNETQIDSFSSENFEKNFSSMTINKRIKTNSNNKYVQNSFNISINEYYSDSSNKFNKDDIKFENNLENKELDINLEKKKVEKFYSIQNKNLLNAMFGNGM